MFLLPGKFLVLAALAAEVVATLLLAERIGLLWTACWLLAAFVLGVVVIKQAGSRAWRTFSGVARDPAASMAADGPVVGRAALMLVAGALLVLPGVLSDVLALVLLTPPGAALVNRFVDRRVGRYVTVIRGGATRVTQRRDAEGRGAERPVDPTAQAGELVEDDDEKG